VLAGALQDLAVRSKRRSDDVGEALDSMTTATTNLSARTDLACAGTHAGEDIVADEMRATIGELHSWSETTFIRIKEITALGSRLSEDISTARSGFSVGGLFSEVVTRCRTSLMQLSAKSAPASSKDATGAAEQRLEDFARHYTMQAEREVHASVTRSADAGPPLCPPSDAFGATSEETGDLGENVELF
jgi:hypothetical protein